METGNTTPIQARSVMLVVGLGADRVAQRYGVDKRCMFVPHSEMAGFEAGLAKFDWRPFGRVVIMNQVVPDHLKLKIRDLFGSRNGDDRVVVVASQPKIEEHLYDWLAHADRYPSLIGHDPIKKETRDHALNARSLALEPVSGGDRITLKEFVRRNADFNASPIPAHVRDLTERAKQNGFPNTTVASVRFTYDHLKSGARSASRPSPSSSRAAESEGRTAQSVETDAGIIARIESLAKEVEGIHLKLLALLTEVRPLEARSKRLAEIEEKLKPALSLLNA